MENNEERQEPELQLEYAGNGPGSRPPTAIGAQYFGEGPEIDKTGLADPPWWFRLYAPFLIPKFREYFEELALPHALKLLECADVPPVYRLGLGLRWGFIKRAHPNFTVSDFATILTPQDTDDLPPDFELRLPTQFKAMELRSTYKLWQRFGQEFGEKELSSIYLAP